MMASRRVALGVVVSAVTLLSVGTAFTTLPGVPTEMQLPRVAVFVVLALAVALNGAVILWHRPRNPIGWVLCASGVVGCAEHLAGSYAAAAIYGGVGPFGPAAAWIFSWLDVFHLAPLGTFALLLFPDGRLPSPRWRPVAWGSALSMGALAVGLAFLPASVPEIGIPNPLGQSDLGGQALFLVSLGFVLLALSSLLCALSLFLRYRRSSGIERQQIKWVAFASVFAVCVVAIVVLGVPLGIGALIASFAAVPLPTAIAIALIRYRLYDIDVLIKRTLVYGATTATIAVTFFVGIVALQGALRPLTSGSELAVAVSTLVSFGLFQPIRRRTQAAVDRRFDRSRYDAARTLDRFSEELRDEVDLERVETDLLAAVSTTMSPEHLSLWLRNPVTISGRPVVRKELA
jgi:hypothetical protein